MSLQMLSISRFHMQKRFTNVREISTKTFSKRLERLQFRWMACMPPCFKQATYPSTRGRSLCAASHMHSTTTWLCFSSSKFPLRSARHKGHVAEVRSHVSMHSAWNRCRQLGRTFTGSPSRKATRHTGQSRPLERDSGSLMPEELVPLRGRRAAGSSMTSSQTSAVVVEQPSAVHLVQFVRLSHVSLP